MRNRVRARGGARGPGRGGAGRGFTFLEIMIVIVILGVLMAVTFARMKGTRERSALLGSAREIVAACNVARQSAISTQRDVWLKFDVNQDRWRIDLNVNPDEEDPHAHYDRDARYDLETVHTLPPKISFVQVTTDPDAIETGQKSEFPLIVFHPDGTATGASVVLETDKGRKMTVQVSAATGRPEAYNGEPKDFADKMKALGIDASAFATKGEQSSSTPMNNVRGATNPNATPAPPGSQQNDGYIQDVLDRLMRERGLGGPGGTETRYGR